MQIDYRYSELTIQNALWLANHKRPTGISKTDWAREIFQKLEVLPPLTRYVIAPEGVVHKRGRRNQHWQAETEACQLRMASILDVLIDKDNLDSPAIRKTGEKTYRLNFDRVTTIFQRLAVDKDEVIEWDPPIIPTLVEFVAFAGAVASLPLYRGRFRRCAKCENYFLRKKLDRRSIVCSDECRMKRGDPTNRQRQARHRAKLKQQQADI